jgi:hypothetical protein
MTKIMRIGSIVLEFLVRTGSEVSGEFDAAPPGVRPHVAGV